MINQIKNLPLGEDSLDIVLQLLSGLLVSQFVLSNDSLEFLTTLSELSSDLESGWEEVVIVDNFNKWLKSGSSLDLGLTHSLGNLHWGSFDTSNDSVWEGFTFLSIIKLLDDDGLFTSSSTCEQNDNSAWLHTKIKTQKLDWNTSLHRPAFWL